MAGAAFGLPLLIVPQGADQFYNADRVVAAGVPEGIGVCDSGEVPSGELPSGTVTFLFSDVEGSTRLVRELGEVEWARALAFQRGVIEERCAANGGRVVDLEGDGCFVAFSRADDALRAALEIQGVLADGRIRVRVGIHTGTPLLTGDGYVGLDVHRAARIAAAAHGSQVVFSSTTRSLVEGFPETIRDLGEHRLKDLAAPERLFQLGHPSFRRFAACRLRTSPSRRRRSSVAARSCTG